MQFQNRKPSELRLSLPSSPLLPIRTKSLLTNHLTPTKHHPVSGQDPFLVRPALSRELTSNGSTLTSCWPAFLQLLGLLLSTGSVVRGNIPAGGGGVGHGVDHVSGERIQDTRQKFILFGTRAT